MELKLQLRQSDQYVGHILSIIGQRKKSSVISVAMERGNNLSKDGIEATGAGTRRATRAMPSPLPSEKRKNR